MNVNQTVTYILSETKYVRLDNALILTSLIFEHNYCSVLFVNSEFCARWIKWNWQYTLITIS